MTKLKELEVAGDSRRFVNIDSDGHANARSITDIDIDHSALFGYRGSSSSEWTVQSGIQYLTLDVDDERVKAGVIVQMLAPDPDCWIWALVMAKDYVAEPARIKIAALRKSALTGTFSGCEVQIVSGPVIGFSPDATIGLSSDELAVPAIGQIVNANILADKLVSRNVSLLFSDAEDFENYFRIRALSYDEDTGDVEGICTASNGSGTASAWIVTLIPGPPSGGLPVPTSIVKQAESTSTSSTITAPADILEGDLLVISLYAQGETSPGIGFYSNALYCKLADGSEASQSFSLDPAIGPAGFSFIGSALGGDLSSPSAESRGIFLVFRPDEPAASFIVGTYSEEATAGDPSAQVIAASGGTAPLVVLGSYASTSAVDPRTMSAAKDGETAVTGNKSYLAWKIYNSAPADVTINMDDEGAMNLLQGVWIELTAPSTEPGDSVVFEDDGSGDPMYPEADGSQITNLTIGSVLKVLGSGSFSGATSVTLSIPAGGVGPHRTLRLRNLVVATDAAEIFMRVNQGAGILSGAADYGWNAYDANLLGTAAEVLRADNSDSEAELALNVGNLASEGGDITIALRNYPQTARMQFLDWIGDYVDSGAVARWVRGGGVARSGTGALTEVQILTNGGNISGDYEWIG